MPPHGGHGHGGGHGGGGHHGGGGAWGPGWAYPAGWVEPAYAELVVPSCPSTYDPVLATDGRVYDNPCLASTAGVAVVRRVKPKRPSGLGSVIDVVPDSVLLLGVFAALAWWYGKRH